MPAGNWLLAAAWAWLALAAVAACLWDRARHRLPADLGTRLVALAVAALLVACGLAVLGAQRSGDDVEPAAGAAVLWKTAAVVVAAFHLAAAATLLGGAIYLAFGRLMGSRACSACGWQAMIIQRLPEVAVAAATTAVGVAVFQGSVAMADRAAVPWQVLELGFVWWLLVANRSVLMVRRPAFLRTASLWLVLAILGGIVWRSCLEGAAGETATAGRLAGGACGVALAVLAAALHRQARFLGLRFDRPAALAEIVGGLSPLRRLAACALGGLLLAGGCGLTLALDHREALAPIGPSLFPVAVAFLWLLVTWGAALLRDRLGPACSPSIAAGTITGLIGLASIWGRLAGDAAAKVPSTGLATFLGTIAAVALGIVWCVGVVRRSAAAGRCDG